eukprot:6205075-Pleurochrysis_carterae.AAC.3
MTSANAQPALLLVLAEFSNDRRKTICCVSMRCGYESYAKARVACRGELTLPRPGDDPYLLTLKVEAVRAVGALRKTLRRARKSAHSPLYTDTAKPLKEPKILRTKQALRQRGARRRDQDLGIDCLERRSGNNQRGGEHGDRK